MNQLATTRPEIDSPSELLARCPVHAATPLLVLPALAHALGIAAVLVKDEGRRPLGSFKALGGVYAGVSALARAAGLSIATLLERDGHPIALPELVCASDGNHGLAVAAAARLARTRARIFLPASVPDARAARIRAKGAEVIRIEGAYDDSVRAAAEAADGKRALLVADTAAESDDPGIADVMAGYGVMAEEIETQLRKPGFAAPTHLFIQAGVGGLAAAMAERLHGLMAPPARTVVVEPETAACVGAALSARRPVPVPGNLHTSAEMLSCGEASLPALGILLRHDASALTVDEASLCEAPTFLADHHGPLTTPSGAAGVAGLRRALADQALARDLALDRTSRVLLFITEAAAP